jgi:hypothetical protein
MSLLNHPIKAVQVLREAVQLPGGERQGLGDWLNKHPLDRHHLHFLGSLIDCPSDGAKLKDQIGTVDLENPGVIPFQ